MQHIHTEAEEMELILELTMFVHCYISPALLRPFDISISVEYL